MLDAKREKLIAATIHEIYLKPERPTMTYLIEQVRARCVQRGLPPPDRRAIKARVVRIDRRTVALKRRDTKGVKATKAVPGQYVASRPLEIVQIDHTEVDVFLVDETTRQTMDKRPWLTLAIDVFTRMVVGFHLSMDEPSRVSLGLCMLNAVYDKSAWLKEREIDASWPASGSPEAVHADNGADFRSHALAWACREEGIKLIFRPVGAPHYGGHIERLIGTMMGRVHFYPGSTFANPAARQSNKSEHFAAVTFREFECALGWEIAGRYNEEIHSALLRPPIAVWREHEAALALRMPKDRMAFWVSFLPDAHRTLRPDGIWLHDIPYWSNALSGQVGRAKGKLLVKFDPRDVSRIFVQQGDGSFRYSPTTLMRALLVQTWRPYGENGCDPAVGWALGGSSPTSMISRGLSSAGSTMQLLRRCPSRSVRRFWRPLRKRSRIPRSSISFGRRLPFAAEERLNAYVKQPGLRLKQRGKATIRENIEGPYSHVSWLF